MTCACSTTLRSSHARPSGVARLPDANSSTSSLIGRAVPTEPSRCGASGSYHELKIWRKIHCVHLTYDGSVVANERRLSCDRPSRPSCERMFAMLSRVVIAGCWPVWTAYCSAGRPNASNPIV